MEYNHRALTKVCRLIPTTLPTTITPQIRSAGNDLSTYTHSGGSVLMDAVFTPGGYGESVLGTRSTPLPPLLLLLLTHCSLVTPATTAFLPTPLYGSQHNRHLQRHRNTSLLLTVTITITVPLAIPITRHARRHLIITTCSTIPIITLFLPVSVLVTCQPFLTDLSHLM